MRLKYLLLMIAASFIYACNADQSRQREGQRQKETDVEASLPEQIAIDTAAILKAHNISLPREEYIKLEYEVYDQCSTFTHFAKDLSHPVLTRIVGYDEKGREKEVVYKNHYDSYVDATEVNVYGDNGKIKESYYRLDEKSYDGELRKMYFYYDKNDSLVKTVSFDFKKRIRADVDKGLGRPGGCIVTPEDYEKTKSWALANIWEHTYDEKGRKAAMREVLANGSQSSYQYKYDNEGRLLEEVKMDGGQLTCVENYIYGKNSRTFIRTWGERFSDHTVDTFKFSLDKHGNDIEEWIVEQGGRKFNREKRFYDTDNRLTRRESYLDKDTLHSAYVYTYHKNPAPVRKTLLIDNQ